MEQGEGYTHQSIYWLCELLRILVSFFSHFTYLTTGKGTCSTKYQTLMEEDIFHGSLFLCTDNIITGNDFNTCVTIFHI